MEKGQIYYTIKVKAEYGGMFHYWHLVKAEANDDGTYNILKIWMLGQDVKVCSRTLGMDAQTIISEANLTDRLGSEEDKIKLANFIMNRLKLDEQKLEELQGWELSCE